MYSRLFPQLRGGRRGGLAVNLALDPDTPGSGAFSPSVCAGPARCPGRSGRSWGWRSSVGGELGG